MNIEDYPLFAEWLRYRETVLAPEGIPEDQSSRYLTAFMAGASTVIGCVRIAMNDGNQAAADMLNEIAGECDAFTQAIHTLAEANKQGHH